MREANEETALIAKLPEQLREMVEAGEYQVWGEGQGGKPVVLDASGHIVAGSGRYPNANDPAEVGRKSAFKRSRKYRELLEAFVGDDPEAKYQFEHLVDLAFEAANGSPQLIDCPHPSICPEKKTRHVVAFKRDGQLIFKLLELLVGKAKETVETTHDERRLEVLVDARSQPVGVFDIDPREAAERREQLMNEGVVEADWFEAEATPADAPA